MQLEYSDACSNTSSCIIHTQYTHNVILTDDPTKHCLQEDLTEEELVTIAGQISPDILFRLCAILHKKTRVYDDLKHRYPHISHEDIAFRVLHAWYESVSASPANRAALVSALKKLGKLRVSHAIATKTYT